MIALKKNRGFGGGVIAGLKQCSSPVIGFTCADDQIKAESILKLYETFKRKNYDIIKANIQMSLMTDTEIRNKEINLNSDL